MDQWFENILQRPNLRSIWENVPSSGQGFVGRWPHVNVIDRDNDILVKAEVPGVEKKDLEISTTENMLSIKATTKFEEEEEKGDYYRCEISRGSFARTVALPGEVDTTRAQATLKDGLLELVLPKVQKAKRQTIAVK
jgi:HSP20 family protein